MSNKKKKTYKSRNKREPVNKYKFGSFVTNNQQAITGAGSMAGGIIGGDAGNVLTGAASGAAAGAFGGPIGMGIGAIVGGLGGILGSGKRKREERRAKKRQADLTVASNAMEFNSDINLNDEASKYGIYKDGGDVSLPKINIELGELQIDPATGDILREYKGVNPETGGKYQPHSDVSSKESKDNMVTAEEGTFIITKGKAKEYKESIDNNDKLKQNSILNNIRNNSRSSNRLKFKLGGIIPSAEYSNNLNTSNINLQSLPVGRVTIPGTSIPLTSTVQANSNTGVDLNSAIGGVANYAPGIMNLIQSNKTPDYLDNAAVPVNKYRSQTISNMPRDINMSPLLNRIDRNRRVSSRDISERTSSPSIARANIANLNTNTQAGIQDAYFQGESINNQIRGQRSNMFNQLGQQDIQSEVDTRNYNLGISNTNRQMDLAQRQYRELGYGQIQQTFQNNRLNNRLKNRDDMLMRLLKFQSPAIANYLDDIYEGGTNG